MQMDILGHLSYRMCLFWTRVMKEYKMWVRFMSLQWYICEWVYDMLVILDCPACQHISPQTYNLYTVHFPIGTSACMVFMAHSETFTLKSIIRVWTSHQCVLMWITASICHTKAPRAMVTGCVVIYYMINVMSPHIVGKRSITKSNNMLVVQASSLGIVSNSSIKTGWCLNVLYMSVWTQSHLDGVFSFKMLHHNINKGCSRSTSQGGRWDGV